MFTIMFGSSTHGATLTQSRLKRPMANRRSSTSMVIELGRCVYQTLRTDGEFILSRARQDGEQTTVLVVAPLSEYPPLGSLERLEHEYSLRDELDPEWALRPLALTRREGRMMLVLDDPGGEPLTRYLSQPMELGRFLRLAISLAASLGELRRRGLIHKDIKPDNIIVDIVTHRVWFTGFGIASRLPRERQAAEPPEVIAGTLAYMAPEQTGRMNRSVDSRSDLYSLGVTLYEMLTGALPFSASDPIEWVHCHVARQPPNPGEQTERIPKSISAIVLKLLAKTAEERYQTPAGLEADLRKCLMDWESVGQIKSFQVGLQDVPDQLLIPEKLYGRDAVCQTLVAAFDRVVASYKSELVLLSGYAGIGKSSVVHELHRAIVLPRGIFISGKFDQHKRDIPYVTLAQAFQELARQILSKSKEEIVRWRNTVLNALGPNGQLMVNLIPELELVIGKQPPVPELAPQEAQNRFEGVLKEFLGAFAQKEHPLVLFLDDLQWLDPATLRLLEQLVTDPNGQHLLLIGAYRDNGVTSHHPLMLTLAAIRKSEAIVHEIELEPLSLSDVNQLLSDALRCELSYSGPLAQLVHDKTGGNPFFTIQFLTNLADEHLLEFEAREAVWRWDLNRICAKGFTDNVVDLMISKLRRLPTPTQEALQQLSCLGNSVKMRSLLAVHGGSEEEIHSELWEAVRGGLVLRVGGSYTFVHDRVQEAAYALVPEEARAEVHLRIGRVLLGSMTSDELAEHLFDVANQLNRGSALVIDRDEKAQLATIDLRAGRKAKASAAYASASVYLAAGMALLDDGDWSRQYELTFNLRLERAECEFLTGNFDTADRLLGELLQCGTSKVDQGAAYHLKVLLHTVRSENAQAVAIALTCLRLFSIDIPAQPTWDQVQVEYEKIWQNLGKRSIESLIDLPIMSDPQLQAAMKLLSVLTPPAYFTDLHLFSLLVCRMVNVSMRHGTSGASAHAFGILGHILGPVFHRYTDGYRFAVLACDLVEKYGFVAYRAKVYHAMGLAAQWTQSITTAIDFNRATFRTAIETGDLTFACYSMCQSVHELLLRNDPLDAVWRESERGLDFIRKAGFRDMADAIVSQQRFIATMQGRTATFSTFSDAQFDETAFEAQLTGDRTATMVCLYWIVKLKTRYLSRDYSDALAAAEKAKALLWSSTVWIQLVDYFYYTALTVAALYEEGSADKQQGWRDLLMAHREKLCEWAENYPPTFADKHALVSAEIARIEGRDLDAMRLYEEAIGAAREHGFVQNEGLANELAAQFYLRRGIEKVAHSYLRESRYCYLRWGALAKVQQLDERYPAIEEQGSVRPSMTIGASVEQLDLRTVMKASHAVAGEIVLEKLIKTLTMIAVEHAGAERGLLILSHGEELRIAAEAKTGRHGVEVQLQDELVTPSALPDSLLHYVIRTQESVILDDASTQNQFSQDEYVRQRRPRSILCLPVVKQAKLMGVLYLENSLAPHVFTPKRLAMLDLLASQAAISLENAGLYADLQQENLIRKRAEEELRRSEDFLAQGERIGHTGSWGWRVTSGLVYWSREHFRIFDYDPETTKPSYSLLMARIHPEDRFAFEEILNRAIRDKSDFEYDYRIVLPDRSLKFLRSVGQALASPTGVFEFIGTAMDITDLKRAEEMRAAMARERELFAQQRATELAKANEALRGCLDALASVPELDDFLGQVMAAITRQLGAVASTLRVLDLKQNSLTLELLFQDGRVMSPTEAKYPEDWRSLPLNEQRDATFLSQPTTVSRILDPNSSIPEALRSYLLALGIKTLLIIPLTLGGRANGQLSFRFTQERDFDPEELEIARALAIQASLAIHLTGLAKTARQSAVLEERNQLAAEIHDALAQSFTGITMQLGVAGEQLAAREGDPLHQILRANEIAKFGLAEARRSILSLHSGAIQESGLIATLQRLAEHSNIAGRLRCNFRSDSIPEERLPPRIQHELLRFAQEAISNAVRHAKPTVVNVTLRWEPPSLMLQVKDNGSGISRASLKKSEGFGLGNMRTRASQIGGELVIHTDAGHGTSIVLTVPIP
jgi:predicted ATPase/signal transduction histidine kinase